MQVLPGHLNANIYLRCFPAELLRSWAFESENIGSAREDVNDEEH
jgi:hypothetical protein